MIITFLKNLFFASILLFLLHFESMSFGPVKISHLWKAFLVIYLFRHLFNKIKLSFVYYPFILLSLLQILNLELFNNFVNAIVITFSILLFPILGIYFLRFNTQKIINLLLFFSCFFILSFIPYELGLIVSIEDAYELTKFGEVGGIGKIGAFQTVHGASVAVASSLLVLFYFILNSRINKFFLIAVFVFGLYILVETYVRTGFFMFIFGALPILFSSKKINFGYLKITISSVFIISLIVFFISSNTAFYNRLTGNNKYYVENSFDKFGSGRGALFLNSIEIFNELNLLNKFIGIGQTSQKIKMGQKLGIAVIPHNGFLELLITNGIVGLSVFLYFLFILRKIYVRFKYFNSSILLKALFYSYIILTLFQTYNMIYSSLFLALSIGLVASERIIAENHKNIGYENFD